MRTQTDLLKGGMFPCLETLEVTHSCSIIELSWYTSIQFCWVFEAPREVPMKRYKRLYSFLPLVIFLLLMSACGSPLGSGGSSLTPLQVLQNSSNAMKQLKSAHFDLNVTSNLLANASGIPTTATPVAGQVNVNIMGSGDENLPDQQSLQITIRQNVTAQNINLSEILLGNKVYIQNPKGQWYVLDKSALERAIGNPFSRINVDPLDLLALIQNANLTDHGTELLNGQELRHISASLDKVGLKLVLTSDPQLSKLFGQQNINNAIDHTKTFQANIDLWIDETNFYVHRVKLEFDLDEDLSSPGTSTTPTSVLVSGLAAHFDSITDLSKFNQPVTITPPANTIPIDDANSIFGLSG